MTFTWHTMGVGESRVQDVDTFHTLDEVIQDMALLAWENPTNHLVDWITDDEKGEVVAVAIFGPKHELLITCADGRVLRFEMPEQYKESE